MLKTYLKRCKNIFEIDLKHILRDAKKKITIFKSIQNIYYKIQERCKIYSKTIF